MPNQYPGCFRGGEGDINIGCWEESSKMIYKGENTGVNTM
jgi:hypothetical protein